MNSQEHLEEIKKELNELVTAKYQRGVKEHGEGLWLKEGLLEEAIDEAIDLIVYLLTIKKQKITIDFKREV